MRAHLNGILGRALLLRAGAIGVEQRALTSLLAGGRAARDNGRLERTHSVPVRHQDTQLRLGNIELGGELILSRPEESGRREGGG